MAKKKTKKKTAKKTVATLTHDEAKRTNIPTAEYQSVVPRDQQKPVPVRYERNATGLEEEKASRNRDLDPQLVWRGKDEQDWSDLVVQAPPLFIQEKIHPKALVDDLRRQAEAVEIARKLAAGDAPPEEQLDLFADFNGLPDTDAKTEFYQHDANWTNRMILGDSLAVMASLAEREGLRGKVQCIYLDPPYGIKFNSNFQWSTTSRDVKDGKADHITREPEQVKAFRDTWRDGIHSYLTYLRDRLTVARDLLSDSGSIFVQIGDENLHLLRALLDEVFGQDSFIAIITVQKTGGLVTGGVTQTLDFVLWYSKGTPKLRQLYWDRKPGDTSLERYDLLFDSLGASRRITQHEKQFGHDATTYRRGRLTNPESDNPRFKYPFQGRVFAQRWKTNEGGLTRLEKANRLQITGKGNRINYRRFVEDFPVIPITDRWESMQIGTGLIYVVQTSAAVIQNCLLMATDPGDLVLDPTCGSGTTAYVAEQWGRRWITIDTSRVALALARARVMGARYPYYLLADSREGQEKEAEVTQTEPSNAPTAGNIRHGFVYQRVPHITLKSIANNSEIDVIWEERQPAVEKALAELNAALQKHPPKEPFDVTTGGRAAKKVDFAAPAGKTVELPSGEQAPANGLLEWEVPRELPEVWPEAAKEPLERFWEARIRRQKEIDASIAAKADHEYLYDKPYEDKKKVRVAGPFTVESLSPHRTLAVDENDDLIDPRKQLNAPAGDSAGDKGGGGDFAQVVLEHLETAGVQQADKKDRITFTSLSPWPGKYIAAEGRYVEGDVKGNGDVSAGDEKRAGIFIGPEFGTVGRQDLVFAAREAGEAGFDVLIACAFNYDAHASEFGKLGAVPVLKARMNADLHMADDLKNTGKGNLFVIFGEPDIDILPPEDAPEDADLGAYEQIRVRINGVDVFKPQTGDIESSSTDGIACWFIDTDYNGESFFVRQAYFLGANDPYKALKTTLKAEINQEAWETLHSDVSREFPKPETGRIAVKVINHLGDEVMKVFRVE